eukprot:NODE_9209_length_1439_cov_9.535061.p4 GENE.NODE_9209_length_1439_cov_9.535061~~NODE_9209_length_1439_cov_9.535061.p4  ORF type:complete len:84 (+),score=40.44 NODE_9209_length_1439_cov_9.535061:1143-1394(+)
MTEWLGNYQLPAPARCAEELLGTPAFGKEGFLGDVLRWNMCPAKKKKKKKKKKNSRLLKKTKHNKKKKKRNKKKKKKFKRKNR